MSMSDFMTGLLDLVFFLFDKTENVIVIIPFVCLFFCFSLGIVRRLMRAF